MDKKDKFMHEPLSFTGTDAGMAGESNLALAENDQDKTPSADMSSEVLQQIWQTTGNASLDLEDEKVISMTGSYSQILDEDATLLPASSQNIQCLSIEPVKEECGVTTGYMDEADISTPVYEAVDPTQMFLSEDRINAFMRLSVQDAPGPPDEHYNQDSPTNDENFDSPHDDLSSPSDHSGQDDSNSELQRRLDQAASFALNQEGIPNTSFLGFPHSRAPPIDPTTISDLEAYARNIATSMDTLIENLTGTLHSISALTVDCVETYRDAVCKTCDTLDSNIKAMYQLMAKCEELSKSMKPIYHLQEQIKEIRRLLDLFESVVHSGSSK